MRQGMPHSVAITLQSRRCLLVHLGVLLRVRQLPGGNLLSFVVGGGLGLPALLQPVGDVLAIVPKSAATAILQTSHCAGILTYLATTSWYFHPFSWLRRPTTQYLRPGCSLRTRRAWGTTTFFILSYGGGMPSRTLRRSNAAAPREVLWGIMPRTAL